MRNNNCSVQNKFIEDYITSKSEVTIIVTNGFQMSGVIKDMDDFTILLHTKNRDQLVYKQAISTISPYIPSRMSNPTR